MAEQNEDGIIVKLAAARANFAPVEADRYNKHLKATYTSMGAILAAVTPALSAEGLVLNQPIEVDLDAKTVKIWTSIRSEMDELEFGSITLPITPIGSQPLAQAIGAALSYGRRYGAMAAAGIDDPGMPDDMDAPPGANRPPANQPPPAKWSAWQTVDQWAAAWDMDVQETLENLERGMERKPPRSGRREHEGSTQWRIAERAS